MFIFELLFPVINLHVHDKRLLSTGHTMMSKNVNKSCYDEKNISNEIGMMCGGWTGRIGTFIEV